MTDDPKTPEDEATFTPVGDATFEPLDKLDQLKEEFGGKFKGMDENLEKPEAIQGPKPERKHPIANAQPRMKSMFEDIHQEMLDIRPFVPKSFTLFHGVTNFLSLIQAPAKAAQARAEREYNRDRISRQSEARIARDESYTRFLDTWKMPPEVAMSYGQAFPGPKEGMAQGTGQGTPGDAVDASQADRPDSPEAASGVPPATAQAAGGVTESLISQLSAFPGAKKFGLTPAILKSMSPDALSGMASQLGIVPEGLASAASSITGTSTRPPGPASAVLTPPYAGVLASGGQSGGTELRDILGVLREILEVVKESTRDNNGDESESVENRRPQFAASEKESQKTESEIPGRPQPMGIVSPGGPPIHRAHQGGFGGLASLIRMLTDK